MRTKKPLPTAEVSCLWTLSGLRFHKSRARLEANVLVEAVEML